MYVHVIVLQTSWPQKELIPTKRDPLNKFSHLHINLIGQNLLQKLHRQDSISMNVSYEIMSAHALAVACQAM